MPYIAYILSKQCQRTTKNASKYNGYLSSTGLLNYIKRKIEVPATSKALSTGRDIHLALECYLKKQKIIKPKLTPAETKKFDNAFNAGVSYLDDHKDTDYKIETAYYAPWTALKNIQNKHTKKFITACYNSDLIERFPKGVKCMVDLEFATEEKIIDFKTSTPQTLSLIHISEPTRPY